MRAGSPSTPSHYTSGSVQEFPATTQPSRCAWRSHEDKAVSGISPSVWRTAQAVGVGIACALSGSFVTPVMGRPMPGAVPPPGPLTWPAWAGLGLLAINPADPFHPIGSEDTRSAGAVSLVEVVQGLRSKGNRQFVVIADEPEHYEAVRVMAGAVADYGSVNIFYDDIGANSAKNGIGKDFRMDAFGMSPDEAASMPDFDGHVILRSMDDLGVDVFAQPLTSNRTTFFAVVGAESAACEPEWSRRDGPPRKFARLPSCNMTTLPPQPKHISSKSITQGALSRALDHGANVTAIVLDKRTRFYGVHPLAGGAGTIALASAGVFLRGLNGRVKTRFATELPSSHWGGP